jgi:UDP-2,3-diacylglucosamine pyrophosphatase LpxH
MTGCKRLDDIYSSAKIIPFDQGAKIVLMSDCHRGDGSWADSFLKNECICYAALQHYYVNGYIYIEAGDGDELWENKKLSPIITVHKDIFQLIDRFHREHRFHMIFGNHDIIKRNRPEKNAGLYYYYDEPQKKCERLFDGLQVHEGLILRYRDCRNILVTHGHQVDPLNSTFWRLARCLVRRLWKPLEQFGLNDPTSAAKNYKKKAAIERKLIDWVDQTECMLIAGHTHRPVFADITGPKYFNDGSCVHPGCITAIEISEGKVKLVRWCIKAETDGTLYTGREILAGPEQIDNYFVQRTQSKRDEGLKGPGCGNPPPKGRTGPFGRRCHGQTPR